MKKIIIFLLTSIFLLSLVSASNLNIHVRPVITGDYQPTTSFDYEFNFSNSDDCTSPVLSRSVTISTDIYGIGYTSLNISSLNSTPAYMCEYRNGLIRKVHTLGSGLFSTIHVNSNSYFEGDVSVNGNINVTGGDICISGGNCLSGTVSGDITEVNTNGEYLIGGADTGAISILINETILNETINALDTDTTYSDLSEFNNDVGFVTNISMNKSIDCSNIDGATSNLCTIVDTDTQIPKWIIDNDYLDNVSDVLTFDETLLNATIDARDSDTTYSESDDYLTLSGEVFGFSETLLNATIAALDTDTNTQIPKWSIDNIYLDNVSDVLTFDETLLNATIDVRSDFDTTIGNCSVDNSCSGILYDSEVNTFIELQSIVSDAILLNKTYADLTYSNTDAQTLSFIGGDNITISGGNSINISSISAGGDSWSDPVDSNIVPDTDNSYDLGDVSHEFKDLYIDGTGNIDTIQTAIIKYISGETTGFWMSPTSVSVYVSGGDPNVGFAATSTTFNLNNADMDTIIDGDTTNNLFFADASTDRVGIGTATPSQKLDVRGDVNISGNYYGNGSTLTGLSGDNSSWNKTYADTLYADISVVDTDTWWSIDNDYLDNVSDVLTFDETVLNSTIDARASSFTYDDYFNQDLNTTDSPSFANIYMDDYLRHTSDVGSNTYLWMGEDQYSFVVGGYNFLKLGEAGTSSEVVFNEDSNTIGYRFETDTYQSALSINALSGQIRMSNLSSCTNIESDVSGFLSCGSGSSFTYDDYFDQYLNTTDNVSFQNIVLGNHSVIYTEERATGNEGGEFGWNSEGESYILYLYDGVNEATITPNSIEVNGDAVFTTLDTGQGANELYEMDQNVLTTSTPSFAGANMTDNNVTDVDCIVFTSGGQICSGS